MQLRDGLTGTALRPAVIPFRERRQRTRSEPGEACRLLGLFSGLAYTQFSPNPCGNAV